MWKKEEIKKLVYLVFNVCWFFLFRSFKIWSVGII